MKREVKKEKFFNPNLIGKNQQGLSKIAMTLIIILISLVVVGIIWAVVNVVVQRGTEQINLEKLTLSAKIMRASIDNSSNSVTLIIKRNAGEGEFSRMNFIFSDGKNSEVVTQTFSLNVLEEKEITLYLSTLDASNIVSVSIIPWVKQDKKEVLGNVLDEYTISKTQIVTTSTSPTVNLVYPTDNTNSNNLNQRFSCNITDNVGVKSLELYIWKSGCSTYRNMTDGFSLLAIGSDSPYGITTNGSDFWITDIKDKFVYHIDRYGNNMTDGFSTSKLGSDYPISITTNGSDFWIVDDFAVFGSGLGDRFVYHTDRYGNNISDGFRTTLFGSTYPYGITTNGSDFWIVDGFMSDLGDRFVYHLNRAGGNMTDGFSTSVFGSSYPYGITTNGNDFWITDITDKFVYHTNRRGTNMTDGFSTSVFGSDSPHSITTNAKSGTPTDFWIVDNVDKFVYHVALTRFGCDIIENQLNVRNMTDGFSLSAIGSSTTLGGFTSDGSDFWIADAGDDFIYHTDKLGNSMTDGFSTSKLGANDPWGITTNGGDFWISDNFDKFVYHTDRYGNNITDGFRTTPFGSSFPAGITTDGNDFWIVDGVDLFVYHVNKMGVNISDGFSTLKFGSNTPRGITTNGSDFWIVDVGDKFVYHTDRYGNNMTDGFSILAIGANNPFGIVTKVTSGTPTDFWITDDTDDFVYHVALTRRAVYLSGISNSAYWDYTLSSYGTYRWNCLGTNTIGNTAWNNQDYTLTISY